MVYAYNIPSSSFTDEEEFKAQCIIRILIRGPCYPDLKPPYVVYIILIPSASLEKNIL